MADKHALRRCIGLPAHHTLAREFLAELFSTFVLVLVINGSKAQVLLTDGRLAEFLANNMAEGFGVMSGILIAGGVTGGQMNPAVTFGLACVGKVEWKKLPLYWLAQFTGAFAAAACVYGVYFEAITAQIGGAYNMTNDDPGLAAIFSTYPAAFLSMHGAIIDQVVGAALLIICVSAISDQASKTPVPLFLYAFYTGLIVVAIDLSFSLNCGAPINPARDFSPRLFSYIVGFPNVFSYGDWPWFWIPLVIPNVGTCLGAFIYVIFIEAHWPK